jgi:regulatory protein
VAGRRREHPAVARERRAAVDDPQVVLDAALRFLEARSRSIAEVRRRLTRAGYRADLVEAAIERLTGLGMLDDAAFARAWVASRDRARPRGASALRRELALKGVERSVVDEVLAERAAGDVLLMDGPGTDGEHGTEGAERAAAERLLARRAAALGRIADPRVRRQRAYALLARNGFDAETCREMAASVLASPAHDGATDETTDE